MKFLVLLGTLFLCHALCSGCSSTSLRKAKCDGPDTLVFKEPEKVPFSDPTAVVPRRDVENSLIFAQLGRVAKEVTVRTSVDRGSSWSKANEVEIKGERIALRDSPELHATAEGLLLVRHANYLGTDKTKRYGKEGFILTLFSADDGTTWQRRDSTVTFTAGSKYDTLSTAARDGLVAAVKGFGEGKFELFTSSDQGSSWVASEHELEVPSDSKSAQLSSFARYNFPLIVDHAGGLHILLTDMALEGPDSRQKGTLYLHSKDAKSFAESQFWESKTGFGSHTLGLNPTKPKEIYRIESSENAIKLTVSEDGGDSWSNSFAIAFARGPKFDLRISGYEDRLFACWRDSVKPSMLSFTCSVDNGHTWSSPKEIAKVDYGYKLLLDGQGATIFGSSQKGNRTTGWVSIGEFKQ